jgi:two-component system heavy metal sensor histidine kinase CusS
MNGALRRGLDALRRSMTAQISLAITLVSVLLIAVLGMTVDRFLRSELREQNDLLLIAHLAFIRDDLAASGYDLSTAPAIVARTERRVYRMHAAIFDEAARAVIARSPRFEVPSAQLPAHAFDAQALPADSSAAELGAIRGRFGVQTTIWVAPDEHRYRVLLGRVALPPGRVPGTPALLVALAIETSNTPELRAHNQRNLAAAILAAAVLASVSGLWIARRILGNARRLGAAASRIGARALDERLPVADTPTELVESTQAFNHMLDRLQHSFERLSAFSSDLAHDLRTPIGNLLGEAQVALSRPRTNDEYRAVLESAVEEYERLSRMIGNMLFLARADNDQAAPAAHWVDLDAALERVLGYFELLAEERGIRLEKSVRAGRSAHRTVWADETMLVRALSNLVSNALRHGARETTVSISADVGPGGEVALQVANEGAGIPREHQSRIFERFYRVDESRQGSASGSGLGLAIVRSIMELHGGRASVASAPGQPTIFTLHFPAPRA